MQKLAGPLQEGPRMSCEQPDISWRRQGASAGFRAEEEDGQMCSPQRSLGLVGEGGRDGGSLEQATDGRLSGRLGLGHVLRVQGRVGTGRRKCQGG